MECPPWLLLYTSSIWQNTALPTALTRYCSLFMTSCAVQPAYLNFAILSDKEGTETSVTERSEPNCVYYDIDPLLVQLLYKVYFKVIQIVLLFLLQTRD